MEKMNERRNEKTEKDVYTSSVFPYKRYKFVRLVRCTLCRVPTMYHRTVQSNSGIKEIFVLFHLFSSSSRVCVRATTKTVSQVDEKQS